MPPEQDGEAIRDHTAFLNGYAPEVVALRSIAASLRETADRMDR